MVKQMHEEPRILPGPERRTPLTLTVPAHLPGGRADDSAGSCAMFQQRVDSHPTRAKEDCVCRVRYWSRLMYHIFRSWMLKGSSTGTWSPTFLRTRSAACIAPGARPPVRPSHVIPATPRPYGHLCATDGAGGGSGGKRLCLGITDWLVPSFREAAAYIMRGLPLKDILLLFMGREEGNMHSEGPARSAGEHSRGLPVATRRGPRHGRENPP